MFTILFIPNIFVLIFATDLAGNFLMGFSYLVLSLFIWLMPLIIFDVKNYFRGGILFLFLAPLEIGFVMFTGLPVNIGFVASLQNTNFNEVSEQLYSNLPLLVFLLVNIIIYCILLSFIRTRSLKNKWKIILLSGFFLINAGLFLKMFSLINDIGLKQNRLEIAFDNTIRKYSKAFPADVILNSINAFELENSNKKFVKQIENFQFNAKENGTSKEDEIYVLVIGESARRTNFHLYGYARETTPKLEKIENLVSFSNVNSNATLTLFSLPQIITRANPDDFEKQFKEKTLVDLFHEAGFYTAWIATQNIATPIIQRLKTVVDYSVFANADVSSAAVYDGDLLKNLQNIISDRSHHKKFIVIHTLGSHFRYSNRYPPNFEKFKPNISRSGYSNISAESKNKLVNSYDNSIYYTDYFLSAVIKKIKQANVVSGLIYLSDHGENLYDDGKTFSHGSEKPTHFEYEIPFLVWYSAKYRKLYPEKIESLYANKDKKASSTNTFYSLSNMANITYKGSEKEKSKSIFNPKYVEPAQRKLVNSKKEVIIIKSFQINF